MTTTHTPVKYDPQTGRPFPTALCGNCKPYKIGSKGRATALCPTHAAGLELARLVVQRGHHDTCDFVKFDTAAYACNCGEMTARAILRAVEG